jgi:hypothetical protein
MAEDREQIESLHLTLEGVVEQLTRAHEIVLLHTEVAAPPAELAQIERITAEVVALRNQVRERLLKALSRPTLKVYKGPEPK